MFNPHRKNFKKPWPKNTKRSQQKKLETKYFQIEPCHGYYGYQLYFLDTDYNEETVLKNVRTCESYIYTNSNQFSLLDIKDDCKFFIDLKQLSNDEDFNKEWVQFREDIIEKTEYCLLCFGLAMHQIIFNKLEKNTHLFTIRCRILNHEPVIGIKNLLASCYGKLVSVRGTVIKRGVSKLLCKYMAFSCSSCNGTQAIKQLDGIFTMPVKCGTKGCRAHGHFIPLLASPNTKTVSYQVIKLQELIGEDTNEIDGVPRMIECELTEDLVDCSVPGDDITLTGIVKVRTTTDTYGKNRQSSLYLFYIDAITIINEKSSSKTGNQTQITFSPTDMIAIQKIQAEPKLFRFLVHSLCPNICGHEIVKAGLLLALFGGTKNEHKARSDSHILVVGDPGLGKSHLLQACSNVAPRGVYVCGNSSTTCGLTVTMTRDGSDFSWEAGALMLADQGCCCIDEFDKMTQKYDCLLEVMEQQTISISKAGANYSLPARVSILATANPVGGHYNKAKTVCENLKMSSPLLSRFDLVFILVDQPDEQHDLLLSEHILALRSGIKKMSSSVSEASREATQSSQNINLRDCLKIQFGESIDYLPHVIFRKYIAYAQKYVHPVLTRDAHKVLLEAYLELRKQYHKNDSTPVTARQLQSLIRLTQARAKCELRTEATGEDALEVVEIMRDSLIDIVTDDVGSMDFTRSLNGSGMSNKKTVTQCLKVLRHKSEVSGKSTFTKDELKILWGQVGVGRDGFEAILDTMNIQGFLLRKGGNSYQLYSGV